MKEKIQCNPKFKTIALSFVGVELSSLKCNSIYTERTGSDRRTVYLFNIQARTRIRRLREKSHTLWRQYVINYQIFERRFRSVPDISLALG